MVDGMANEIPKNDYNESDEINNLIMTVYNQQKEDSREPPIKKFSERVEPAPIKKNQVPRFAYPLYPYAKGGAYGSQNER